MWFFNSQKKIEERKEKELQLIRQLIDIVLHETNLVVDDTTREKIVKIMTQNVVYLDEKVKISNATINDLKFYTKDFNIRQKYGLKKIVYAIIVDSYSGEITKYDFWKEYIIKHLGPEKKLTSNDFEKVMNWEIVRHIKEYYNNYERDFNIRYSRAPQREETLEDDYLDLKKTYGDLDMHIFDQVEKYIESIFTTYVATAFLEELVSLSFPIKDENEMIELAKKWFGKIRRKLRQVLYKGLIENEFLTIYDGDLAVNENRIVSLMTYYIFEFENDLTRKYIDYVIEEKTTSKNIPQDVSMKMIKEQILLAINACPPKMEKDPKQLYENDIYFILTSKDEEKEQKLLLQLQQKREGEPKDTELSDDEKLKLVGILDDALLYAEELGQKEMLQKYFIDFSCDALNYLVPNELEEFDVKAFALFYISGAYFVLRKLYIDAHPEAKDVDDMHEIKEFEELKLLAIAAIIAFPPKENEKLSKYAAMVIALSQADDETEYNYILNKFGRETAKATYINEWLNRVMFFIKNATATFETIKKNKYTELDFLVYFMFTNYTIFCTAKNQKSAEEYSKLTFHWFVENIPSEYELNLEFAEEFYWNRTEAYNKVMMSNSDMKEAALAQTYQQFISKDNANEPFEKCLVIGNFMETFNYSVEASTLISTINKSLSEYFKKICDEFE